MAPELAAGYPSAKDAKLIPTIFSKMVRGQLYAATCLPKITTSGYLGELNKEGDTVEIATSPRVVTKKYRRGQKLEIDTQVGESLTLTVDKSRYWTQFFDSLDLRQTHIKMMAQDGGVAKNAASQIAVDIETEAFAAIPAMAHASNVGATAGVKSGIYKLGTAAAPQILSAKNTAAYISQFFSVIAEQNVADGDGGKSVVVPEWARHYLVNSSDLKDASAIGEKSTLRTNRLGTIFGIEVYTSNLLDPIAVSGQTYKAWPFLALQRSALNFVVNLTEVETTKPYDMKGTLTSGIVLYGWGNVRSEGIAVGYGYPGDAAILAAS